MALTPAQEAAFARLEAYNGNGYNPATNPYGFARGGNIAGVYVQSLKDVAFTGRLIADLFDPATVAEIAAARTEVAQNRQLAQTAATNAAASAASVDGAAIAARFTAVEGRATSLENAGYRHALQIHFGS